MSCGSNNKFKALADPEVTASKMGFVSPYWLYNKFSIDILDNEFVDELHEQHTQSRV